MSLESRAWQSEHSREQAEQAVRSLQFFLFILKSLNFGMYVTIPVNLDWSHCKPRLVATVVTILVTDYK